MTEGPQRVDRGPGQGRPDRPRDQAARRPAGRPAAPALVDGGRRRRVRPRRRHRHRRGHHRGGRRRDRRRDRPGRRRDPAAGQRRLVRARPRRDHRPARLRPRRCRSTPTPTTRSAASSSPSSGGCPSAATRSPPTATRSASSRCARTASRPSASASAAPSGCDGQRRATLTRTRKAQVLRAPALRAPDAAGTREASTGLAASRWDGGAGQQQVDLGGSTRTRVRTSGPLCAAVRLSCSAIEPARLRAGRSCFWEEVHLRGTFA